jgi:hypothetical protein
VPETVTEPPGLTALGVMIMFAAQAGAATTRVDHTIAKTQSLFMPRPLAKAGRCIRAVQIQAKVDDSEPCPVLDAAHRIAAAGFNGSIAAPRFTRHPSIGEVKWALGLRASRRAVQRTVQVGACLKRPFLAAEAKRGIQLGAHPADRHPRSGDTNLTSAPRRATIRACDVYGPWRTPADDRVGVDPEIWKQLCKY